MNREAVRKIINAAVDKLYQKDGTVLRKEDDMQESTIIHRLAMYLEEYFQQDGYVVDIEYSKMSRTYNGVCENVGTLLVGKLSKSPIGAGKNDIYPDIVVHKRDTNDNLIEIEVSIAWRNSGKLHDLRKVNEYMKLLRYTHGVYVELAERIEDVKVRFGPFSI